jgi:hypothetical protein
VSNRKPRSPVEIGYGLGIFKLDNLLGHNGAALGYSTAMFYLPSQESDNRRVGQQLDQQHHANDHNRVRPRGDLVPERGQPGGDPRDDRKAVRAAAIAPCATVGGSGVERPGEARCGAGANGLAGHAQLRVDVGEVAFDDAVAQVEAGGDLVVHASIGDQLQYLQLAPAQVREVLAVAPRWVCRCGRGMVPVSDGGEQRPVARHTFEHVRSAVAEREP